MVQLPATTRMGESRTWGPMNPVAPDPLTYRLVVNRLAKRCLPIRYRPATKAPAATTNFWSSRWIGDQRRRIKRRQTVA